MTPAWEGLLLIDKPDGPTSHDIVARIRRLTGQSRIGHTGTLDPMASGLLALVLGRATRLARFLPHSPKSYVGTFQLGRTTDSDDITGETIEQSATPLPEPATVLAEADKLLGRQQQIPPSISARKVGGQRLYRLARRGIVVDRPATEIEVFRFEVRPTEVPDIYEFEAEVTAGAYIRGLARDLGVRLGCGGVLASLRRSAIGPMTLDAALTLEEAQEDGRLHQALIPPGRMPLEPPAVKLDDAAAVRLFSLGGAPEAPAQESLPAGMLRVLAPDGGLLGLAECREGRIRPKVVLARDPDSR